MGAQQPIFRPSRRPYRRLRYLAAGIEAAQAAAQKANREGRIADEGLMIAQAADFSDLAFLIVEQYDSRSRVPA